MALVKVDLKKTIKYYGMSKSTGNSEMYDDQKYVAEYAAGV